MQMHKHWQTVASDTINEIYDKNTNSFRALAEIFNIKDKLEIDKLIEKFQKQVTPEPSPKLINHLMKLSSDWMKRDGFYYQELMTSMINKNIPNLQNDIKNLRKSSLCMYCDWHNQNFINLENFTLIYKNDFCLSLIDNHIDTLY